MKFKLALIAALFTTSAWAGGEHSAPTPSPAASMLQSQNAYGGSAGVSVNVEGDDYPHIPVSSAIAPSVTSNVICPIVTPSSKAGSVWFFSGSGTTGTTLNAICVAFHLNQPEVVERMTCQASKEYRDANPHCEVQ